MKRPPQQNVKVDAQVTCASCLHFILDTEGISITAHSREHFMGRCAAGEHPHSPMKQFAHVGHRCGKHTDKKNNLQNA